jgi:hypothetical protein
MEGGGEEEGLRSRAEPAGLGAGGAGAQARGVVRATRGGLFGRAGRHCLGEGEPRWGKQEREVCKEHEETLGTTMMEAHRRRQPLPEPSTKSPIRDELSVESKN